jgi:hypothetical protein
MSSHASHHGTACAHHSPPPPAHSRSRCCSFRHSTRFHWMLLSLDRWCASGAWFRYANLSFKVAPPTPRTHAREHTHTHTHTSTRVEVARFRLLALAHQCARTLSPIRTRTHAHVRAQDTFDPEFYLEVYETVSADGVTRSLHSGRCAAHAFMPTDGPHRHISEPICLCLLAQI